MMAYMGRPRGSGADNSNQTEMKLIEVATNLFSRNGFKGTSIRDIAREMGMTTANIYHHFGSKEGLLHAVEKLSIGPLLEKLQSVVALDSPPLDRFTSMLRTHLTYTGTYRKKAMIFFLGQEASPLDMGYFKKNLYPEKAEILSLYRREMERVLVSTGRTGDPTTAALSAFGVINWFLFWYRPEGRLSMEAVIERIIAFILYGFIGEEPGISTPQKNKEVQLKTDKKERSAKGKRRK
jgi:AcrR family transcriptional regulator